MVVSIRLTSNKISQLEMKLNFCVCGRAVLAIGSLKDASQKSLRNYCHAFMPKFSVLMMRDTMVCGLPFLGRSQFIRKT